MLAELEAKGVRLAVNAGKLVVDTDHPLTDEQREYIRKHKQQLLDELEARIDAMRATQPEGWGWWGFTLDDASMGSIRGPFPDLETAMQAVQAEFPERSATRLVPLQNITE